MNWTALYFVIYPYIYIYMVLVAFFRNYKFLEQFAFYHLRPRPSFSGLIDSSLFIFVKTSLTQVSLYLFRFQSTETGLLYALLLRRCTWCCLVGRNEVCASLWILSRSNYFSYMSISRTHEVSLNMEVCLQCSHAYASSRGVLTVDDFFCIIGLDIISTI